MRGHSAGRARPDHDRVVRPFEVDLGLRVALQQSNQIHAPLFQYADNPPTGTCSRSMMVPVTSALSSDAK